jgi:hypothetical protein
LPSQNFSIGSVSCCFLCAAAAEASSTCECG